MVQEEVRKIIPRQPRERIAILTYEDFGMVPVKDFDYKNYDKVTIPLFRIGVDIVEADIQATLPKGHGDQRHFALYITSVGSKARHWI